MTNRYKFTIETPVIKALLGKTTDEAIHLFLNRDEIKRFGYSARAPSDVTKYRESLGISAFLNTDSREWIKEYSDLFPLMHDEDISILCGNLIKLGPLGPVKAFTVLRVARKRNELLIPPYKKWSAVTKRNQFKVRLQRNSQFELEVEYRRKRDEKIFAAVKWLGRSVTSQAMLYDISRTTVDTILVKQVGKKIPEIFDPHAYSGDQVRLLRLALEGILAFQPPIDG